MTEEIVIPEAPVIPVEPETPAVVIDDKTPSESATEETETIAQDDSLPKPDKSQSKFDKRIAQLNRKIGEQQARADMLQRQLEETKPKPEPVKSGLKLADFDYDEDKFSEAITKEAEQNAIKRHNEQHQAKTQKETDERLVKTWGERTSKADSKYDDFEEVVGELKPTSFLSVAIMQAENGEDIAYYLGKNLAEAQRIANLDPVAAIREIGRLEAKLLSEPPKTKEPSKAPAPIVPLNGKANLVSDTPSDEDDTATWMRKERARVNKARA